MTDQKKKEVEKLIWNLQNAYKEYGHARGMQGVLERDAHFLRPADEVVAEKEKDANESLNALFEILGMNEYKLEIN